MQVKTLIISILFIFIFQNNYGQRIWKDNGELNFCKKENKKELIGHDVKIWSNGGIYTKINKSKSLNWPSKEIKKKSGENAWRKFYPQPGDIGTIVHIFDYDKKRTPSAKLIYLLEIRGNYVPIGCGYLTTVNNMDQNEEFQHWRVQDSIYQIEYASGCEFKTRDINNCWNRAGINAIDTMPEIFSCNLKNKGIDTIILSKNIFDNGSLPNEKAYVLWIENGEGYIKGFYNNKKHSPTESEIIDFNVQSIIDKFYELDIAQVKTLPRSNYQLSHSMGYCMQVMTPSSFYCERIPNYQIDSDLTHPKSIWWKLIEEKIKEKIP